MNSPSASKALLPAPARYFPVDAGAYAMKAGLARLGTEFGNGDPERQLVQIDRQWPTYRGSKLRARRESLDKYYCAVGGFDDASRHAVTQLLLDTLLREHPTWFRRQQESGGYLSLRCRLSGEVLRFDDDLDLVHTTAEAPVQPTYRDGLDALASQMQEDLSFVSAAPAGHGRVLMLHLCAPNHWAASDRIGRSFQGVHAPVPQFQRIARQTPALLANLRDRGPYVRFAWGLATDRRLNHHPQPEPGCSDAAAWQGRHFDPQRPSLFLRVERQVLVGLPAVNGVLFAIRTYLTDVADLTPEQRRVLAAALRTMDEEIAGYKGLAGARTAMAAWLESPGLGAQYDQVPDARGGATEDGMSPPPRNHDHRQR